jgi:hypothetical protein
MAPAGARETSVRSAGTEKSGSSIDVSSKSFTCLRRAGVDLRGSIEVLSITFGDSIFGDHIVLGKRGSAIGHRFRLFPGKLVHGGLGDSGDGT